MLIIEGGIQEENGNILLLNHKTSRHDQYLEKEATLKGIPLAQAHDIDIPPPRPKRKPSNPYPRKVGSVSLSSSGEVKDGRKSQGAGSQTLAMEEVAPGERPATETRQRKNGTSEDGSFSNVYNLFQDTPSVPISHVKENCANPDSFRVFVPLVQETGDKTLVAESSVTVKGNEETKSNGAVKYHKNMEGMEGVYKNLRAEPIPKEIADVTEKPEMLVSSVKDNPEGFNSYLTSADVQVKENSSAKCRGTAEPQRKIHSTVDNLGVPSSVNPFTTPIISVIPEIFGPTLPQFLSQFRLFHLLPNSVVSLVLHIDHS
ncbi:hypothetical protein J5N97_025466 [Dioscorea zingiberensis]|uniref:Uncharacterized protein n=1 Tax=Dioscorea zingiberensis TaxID=325984 RepID=A0A9D5C9A4_9LILI|nr:hypothetical protein J5N97_025466 [Dioscorea zingiberensis]